MANKTLNNVKINMTLKSTTTRAKLSTSSEDLAVQMGKINKWYDSLVPTGGASGNILEWDSDGVAKWVTPSFLDEKVKSTLLAQSTAEASYRPTFVTGAGTGGVNIIDSFKVNHTPGTTSAVGNTGLVLGNATASGTVNNEEGQLKLYSSGTSFHTLKGTTVSSEVIHVLPSTGGTILNHLTTTYTQTSSSSATGAYEIGKIKINGTTTTIYGKDTNTTYTATDGIKIESNVIKHTNSIATAASVFKKISYDAQGHITGTANVTKSDIPALDYIAKPGQVGSASRPIYINSSSVPTQCDTPASGAYWAGVPYVGSNGVMEIGKYIDFHGTNASTNDYDYRIAAETQTLYLAPKSSGDATYNLIRMQSPDYNQIQFQTTKTGKAYTSTGIVVYPLTTSGQTMLIQSDGNTVVGGGESPRTLYSNSYDNMDTAENETLYLASDSSEIHLITNCQAYSGRKVLKVQDAQLVKSGGQWISARDVAPVYANKPNTQDGGYYPAWFAKTKSGGWSMGVLSAQDNLYITYTTDANYSGGSNVNTYQVQFQNKSGTVALTSDLAGYVPMETVTTDTSADTYFTKTGWVNWNKNAGTSTTNLPTANWGILLTKALPSVQMFIPDNASGLYFRRKADASTAATAWWGITGTAGNTYNLDNFISLSSISATNSGSGNAVTSISYSNGVITATKGNSFLPLSGGTMTGDISFATISPSSYPAASKGIKWGGGTDAIDMYYNLRASDSGELIINMRDDANVRTSFAYNGTVKSYIDTNGTYNGNATTSSRSYALYTDAVGSSSSTHAGALQTYFEANKSTIVRNQGLGYYSSSYSNGSFYLGYFLSGYDSNPYGGFFVCHYNTPYYVGIQNGTYVEHKLLTDKNYTSYITQLGTVSKGSTTKGIYLDAGVPKEMTYALNSTVNSGTANCIAYYSGANAISSAPKVTYVNANNSASTPATVAGLHIESPTYGNTAANMIGGVAGVFSYGDGGPQIRFKDGSSTQAGALIFTADDVAAAGTSWHFVSTETDWNVISKRFHAKTSISIGTDKPSTSYNLTVNGTSYFNNTITIKGTSSGNASIYYASYGNTRNATSIRFYDGDGNGHGVQVGGGGLTVLGGGESAQAVFDNLSTLGWSASSEVAIVASDGPIYFMTNCDAFANRKSINIDTSGYLNTSYINMNVSDQDNLFTTASSVIYSTSDKYLRRVSLTKLGSTLGPYVGPYVTNVSDGSVIHQTNYNSAGGTRPVHRFIRSLRTNKLAFTLPANITIEYSTNAGSSWTSFGYTDAQKAGPFISRHAGGSITIGAAASTDFPNVTTSMQTRITITNDGRDCMIDQFYIWMSTSGHGTTVDIQYTTQSAKTTWVDWRTGVGLAGWSGPNVINVSELRYGNTIYSIRFTFKITSVSADYKTSRGTIHDIQAYGSMACWTSKNNMMMHDSLYTWNHDQVATFPAEIRVPTQLRVYNGNYGTMLRSDGTNTYFLVTDSGSAESGSWNSLRPFFFNNSTGYVTMGNGASIYGGLLVTTNATSRLTLQGATTSGSSAYDSNNPRIRFANSNASQNVELIYNDNDNVLAPSSIALRGNQGGEWLSVPRLEVNAYHSSYAPEISIKDPNNKTFNLYYGNSHASGWSILQVRPGNSAGVCVTLGCSSGGATIVGAGESAYYIHQTFWTAGSNPYVITDPPSAWTPDVEKLFLSSDTEIYLMSGMQNYTSSAHTDWTHVKTALFDTDGSFRPSINNKGSIGDSTHQWSTIYGATMYENGTSLANKYAPKSHTHNYAGSSSAGGAATSANKLNTNAGTVANPVYFTNGVPTACDYPKSGAWAPTNGGVPIITSSGVLEIGPYIDFHSKTSTADWDLRLSEESANLLALKNASPTFRIHSTGHTNAALELWREGDNYTDYRIINTGGQFKIQSDYIEGTGHTDWFDMLHLAYTTGNATFKGSGTFGGIITTYRESSTTDSLPAGIVFSNKDTTTGLTNSGAHIYAYNDHANPSYGENLVINAGGCLFIGAGESADNHYTAIKSGLSTSEDIFITADGHVRIQGCGDSIAARKGMMVYTTNSNNGNYHQILPTVADTATNNVGSIGSSSYKWNAVYASSYYGEFDCLNEVANNTQYAMVLAMNPNTHQPNTLRKTPNAIITFKNGTASEEGWAQITLGNETKTGTAGNSTGWLKLYSSSSGFHYITGASTTSAITHTLPAVGGTILNSGNYLQYTRSIQKLYAATSTKGWRRILTIPASNASGYTIGRYEFHFTRQWNNGPPESFGVRVICNYTTPVIHLLYAEQNSRLLTDFRVARSSDSTKIHFEVWYDATTKNDFSVRYVIQDPYIVPHDFCTFPTETDGSSAGSSFLPVVSDSPTSQATIPIPAGGISQFNLRQVSGSYGGYFGMADAAGSDSAWIRTTSQGLLPHQSGDGTSGGHCYLGTSGWYFANAYINRVYGNTADFESFQPRHSNEFNMKQMGSSYNYIWFNYRLITDDTQGYTTEPTTPLAQYWFGCGRARNALAKVVTSGMTIYPGAANTTSYSTTLQSASLTANRTATLPNATGTIPLITEKYNSPSSTATSYNLTNATSFKLLMITTKPSSSLFGETTVIVPAPTAAGTTKTYVNWPGVNAEASSQPTRALGGNIRVRYTNNDTCTIDCVLADYYLQAGASVSSGSTSGFSVYITRIIGISY